MGKNKNKKLILTLTQAERHFVGGFLFIPARLEATGGNYNEPANNCNGGHCLPSNNCGTSNCGNCVSGCGGKN